MCSAVKQKQNRQTHNSSNKQTQRHTQTDTGTGTNRFTRQSSSRHIFPHRQTEDRQHREQEGENPNLDLPSAKGLQEEVLLFLPLM